MSTERSPQGASPTASPPAGPPPSVANRRLPPVTELLVSSLALMVSGGVLMAAHLPARPPLVAPAGLLATGALLTALALTLLSRARPFAWDVFFLVLRWALLAYLVVAGLLMFVFAYDHTGGATLAVLVATLAVFALDVPALMAFTVARYHEASPAGPA